jgi:hypothetical protein
VVLFIGMNYAVAVVCAGTTCTTSTSLVREATTLWCTWLKSPLSGRWQAATGDLWSPVWYFMLWYASEGAILSLCRPNQLVWLKEILKSEHKDKIMKKYGSLHQKIQFPRELLLGQSEREIEYDRTGLIIK